MYLSSLLFPAATLCFSVHGNKLSCGQACQEVMSGVAFIGTPSDADYFTAQCGNILRVKSAFICMRSYCSSADRVVGLRDYNSTCLKYAGASLLSYSIIDDITEDEARALKNIDVADFGGSDQFDDMVFVSETLFDVAFRTTDTWNASVTIRTEYGYAMIGFWLMVAVFGFFSRVSRLTTSILYEKKSSSSHVFRSTTLDKLKLWMKHRITTPALFSHHAAEPVGWCTVPARVQSLMIAIYVVINIVMCCTSYHVFDGNLYWPSTAAQLSRYVGDRTGVLAIANLPMLWVFAMRNNVLLWLTGWSFVTFNQFHRWIARVATVEAVVHSIAYTVVAFQEGGKIEYFNDWMERYWWCGAMAVATMCFICASSALPVRQCMYELFLVLHIALAVLFIITIWYHVEIFDGEYNGYISPCFVVWVLDRILRTSRLIRLNLSSNKSTVSYKSESEIVRIDFDSNVVVPRPGTYYYIYVLSGTRMWESHPFTLSSWHSYGSTEVTKTSSRNENSLSFILRPYDSFTARIRNAIVSARAGENGFQTSSSQMRVLIEGPYGHHLNLNSYNSILFVTGGTGITVALSHICSLHESVERSDAVKISHIRLIWAIRDKALFDDVFARELETWLSTPRFRARVAVEIEVYITGGGARDSSSISLTEQTRLLQTMTPSQDQRAKSKVLDEDSEITALASDHGSNITFCDHRPRIRDIVTRTVERNSQIEFSKMAVVVCGPARMADDTRAAVTEVLGRGYHGVDFYPESYTW